MSDEAALRKLYGLGERGFWVPDRDINWDLRCWGDPPRYFRMAWRKFPPFLELPEVQQLELCDRHYKWVIDQGVHGERFGMLAAGWIAGHSESTDEQMLACELAWEEARHYQALSRLAGLFGPVGPPHPKVVEAVELARDNGPLGVFLGLHAGERAGVPSYALLARFGGPLMKAVYDRIGSDEARHLGFGAIGIKRYLGQLPEGERNALAQRILDGFANWAYPSPVWDGYGFDEEAVSAFWMPVCRSSRLRGAIVKAFHGLGLQVE